MKVRYLKDIDNLEANNLTKGEIYNVLRITYDGYYAIKNNIKKIQYYSAKRFEIVIEGG